MIATTRTAAFKATSDPGFHRLLITSFTFRSPYPVFQIFLSLIPIPWYVVESLVLRYFVKFKESHGTKVMKTADLQINLHAKGAMWFTPKIPPIFTHQIQLFIVSYTGRIKYTSRRESKIVLKKRLTILAIAGLIAGLILILKNWRYLYDVTRTFFY